MSITTWNRLEVDVVHEDPLAGLDESLAARVADPLWLLARQWQMGELRGEDGGSLVTATATTGSYAIGELAIRGTRLPVAQGVPLEVRVEAEPRGPDLQLRLDGGSLFVTMLEEHVPELSARARARYGWAQPVAGSEAAFVRLVAHLPDGEAIYAAAIAGSVVDDLGVTGPSVTTLANLVASWLDWYRGRRGPEDGDAWVADRLEHAFSVRAQIAEGTIELAAAEYRGGRLDRDDFVVERIERTRGTAPERRRHEAQPFVVDVPGMPVVRFWEIEDTRLDLGRVSLGPGDLGAALTLEVALTYASDWMLVPLVVPVGALHRIEELVAVDSFGVRHVIRPATEVRPDPGWSLWSLTPRSPSMALGTYLFTPAAVADVSMGDVIEEVELFRDELANVVWARERVVPDARGVGASVNRRRPPRPPPASTADRVYVPLPALPTDRIPLAKVPSVGGALLRRARPVAPAMGIAETSGSLLRADFALHDEEVGREGLIVTRRWQLALDADGQRHVWRTRARAPGTYQRSLRLAFDDLVEPRVPVREDDG